MKISAERIKSLQLLLKELGLNYTEEQTQDAGLAIMRFALVRAQRKFINNDNEGEK